MEIIPVIDIKGGRAVHAKQGLRELYEPLNTRLCSEGDPLALATALLTHYPFRILYIADLDALMSTGSNRPLIQSLINRYPKVEFWIDQGLSHLQFKQAADSRWITVLGTESLTESVLANSAFRPDRMILSLDFSASGLLGPKVLLENEQLWPQRIIIMNLSSIGAEEGPNWERLEYFRTQWPNQKFVAAGGVRHEADLRRIASLGFIGTLCATALHRGALRPAAIERLMSE
ncbi:MAG: HisA/HisF-related TIM barrel protein [Methylococcales bacterium]